VKIKICGLCRPEDAAAAAQAGADYLGVILAQRGPRHQSAPAARSIYDAAPDLLHVGVFADQPLQEVVELAELLQLDVIQLHGAESALFINELECATDCVIWKSVVMTQPADLPLAIDRYADDVDGLLLDGPRGGSGMPFDWTLAHGARSLLNASVQLIVAGGLNPDNVREVVARLSPDIVDVASGVEQEVGIKSKAKMTSFVRNARGA